LIDVDYFICFMIYKAVVLIKNKTTSKKICYSNCWF